MHFRIVLIIGLLGVFFFSAGCNKKTANPTTISPDSRSPANAELIIAGSGSNLLVTEKLAHAYKQKTGVTVHIPASIGSSGAVNAVQTGILELGLISRPLTDKERDAGLREVPYARVAVILGASNSAPDSEISSPEVVQILNGTKTTWSNGTKIFVQVREDKDSSNLILFDQIPGYKTALFNSYQENVGTYIIQTAIWLKLLPIPKEPSD